MPPKATTTKKVKQPEASIVAPFYNEEGNIEEFFERIELAMKGFKGHWEIICVDDASTDKTFEELSRWHQKDDRIKVIRLARNFGKEAALTAGLHASQGKAVIPIDTDLQDPPELITTMLKKWKEGFDIVLAKRQCNHGQQWLKTFLRNSFYKSLKLISRIEIPEDTGDFRLLDRKVVDVINQLPERTRFMKGLFCWPGFKSTTITFERPERHQGNSSWGSWKLWEFALDGLLSFSTVPLKIWTYLGAFVSLGAFIYAAFLVIRTLIFGIDVPGYASIMVVMLMLGGIQLLSLGIIGEYIGRIYRETKQRPIYIIQETIGIDNKHELSR